MPYIKLEDRPVLRSLVEEIVSEIKQNHHFDSWGGKVNYAVSLLVTELWNLSESGARYSQLEKAIGSLECVKLELYRRRGSDMEDKAIAKNGDITTDDDIKKEGLI